MKQSNLINLSPSQRKAVIWNEGPLLLLAGPGSGKTHTITHHLIHLLNLGIPPETILVITFTKEAALSMQRRFFTTYHEQVPIQFATFHSFFYQILRSEKQFQNSTIISTGRKRIIMHHILKQSTIIQCEQQEEFDDSLEKIMSAISYYKNTGDYTAATESLSDGLKEHFSYLFRAYRYEMKQHNYIDFDDMLYECLQLLQKNKELRMRWQYRFRYLLIDEFQDINPMQYEIMKLLTVKPYHIFAVGDDDQSIYGFRGSKPDLMKTFVKEYGAAIYHLERNYRSGKDIVEASEAVINENQNRFAKELISGREELSSKVIVQAYESKTEQSREVLEAVRHFTEKEGNAGSTLAILFRTNSYMQGMAARLSAEGIPFAMKENCRSIYEHPIVKDICAYLRLAKEEWSVNDMVRIMNKPVRFIGRDAVAESIGLDDVLSFYSLNAGHGKSYLAERNGIMKLSAQLNMLRNMSLQTAIRYILKVIGYEKYLQTVEQYKDSYEEVLTWLKEDAARYQDFAGWMEAQKRYNLQLEEKKTNRNHMDAPIQLMTVHAAKGLEFHTVIIPDCNEKIYPNLRMPEQEALEEERRIFYVGMTRAIEKLCLFYVAGTKEHPKAVSRFLKPLLKEQKNTNGN